MNKKPNYTEAENKFIRTFFDIYSDHQLAKRLGRSIQSLRHHRYQLNLYRSSSFESEAMNWTIWTEIKALKAFYDTYNGLMKESSIHRYNQLIIHPKLQVKRNRSRLTNKDKAKIFELKTAGLSNKQIGLKLKFTRSEVHYTISKILPYKGECQETITLQSKI